MREQTFEAGEPVVAAMTAPGNFFAKGDKGRVLEVLRDGTVVVDFTGIGKRYALPAELSRLHEPQAA